MSNDQSHTFVPCESCPHKDKPPEEHVLRCFICVDEARKKELVVLTRISERLKNKKK